jgi:uncharacterized membrane protein YkoI
MKKSQLYIVRALLLATAVFLVTPPIAARDADIGEQQAVNIAKGVHPGRVLSVKSVRLDTGAAWRIKTLSAAGDVHIVTVDAGNGRVLSTQ